MLCERTEGLRDTPLTRGRSRHGSAERHMTAHGSASQTMHSHAMHHRYAQQPHNRTAFAHCAESSAVDLHRPGEANNVPITRTTSQRRPTKVMVTRTVPLSGYWIDLPLQRGCCAEILPVKSVLAGRASLSGSPPFFVLRGTAYRIRPGACTCSSIRSNLCAPRRSLDRSCEKTAVFGAKNRSIGPTCEGEGTGWTDRANAGAVSRTRTAHARTRSRQRTAARTLAHRGHAPSRTAFPGRIRANVGELRLNSAARLPCPLPKPLK